MNTIKRIKLALVILAMCFGNQAYAGSGDTSIALLNMSGSVPEVFSVTARGLPGDLDLTPNVVVVDRLIGILHFKFNLNAASITVSGAIGGVGYTFGSAMTLNAACTSITMAAVAATASADYKTAGAAALVGTGIEEDCQVLASWGGTVQPLPLAGVVTVTITVTMVAA